MLSLYRVLLRLYPAAYRAEYGDEMLTVLSEVYEATSQSEVLKRLGRGAYEAVGLLRGALEEHFWALIGSYPIAIFSPRRFTMHSEFRFPKATVTLMMVILVAVVMTIEKAKAISDSVPPAATQVPPIRPEHFTTVSALLMALAGACLVGLMGWAIFHVLHRSGVRRLSDVSISPQPRP